MTNGPSEPIKFWRHRIFAARATRARLYHGRDGEGHCTRLRGCANRRGGQGHFKQKAPKGCRKLNKIMIFWCRKGGLHLAIRPLIVAID